MKQDTNVNSGNFIAERH